MKDTSTQTDFESNRNRFEDNEKIEAIKLHSLDTFRKAIMGFLEAHPKSDTIHLILT